MTTLSRGELSVLLAYRAIKASLTDVKTRISVVDVATTLQYDYVTVCLIVRGLETKGLIASERIGRLKLIVVTGAGTRALKRAEMRLVVVEETQLCDACRKASQSALISGAATKRQE